MPYADPEKQRLATRAATARWYESRKNDEDFKQHRRNKAKEARAKCARNTRRRTASLHESNVIATLAKLNPKPNHEEKPTEGD